MHVSDVCVAFFVVIYSMVLVESAPSHVDPMKMAKTVKELIDSEEGIGHAILQRIYDENPHLFRQQDIDSVSLLNQIKQKAEDKLQGVKASVQAIKRVVEEEYGSFTTDRKNWLHCCEVNDTNLEERAAYLKRVNLSAMCLRKSKTSPPGAIYPLSERILEVMKRNLDQNPDLQWQYFGTEYGTFAKYPAHNDKTCGTYDPRYRPWYVETAVPHPKDVVIVLDVSGSMIQHMMMAKNALKTIIDALNPNDRMGLVYFSNMAATPFDPGKYECFHNELAFATPDNKEKIKEYMNQIKGSKKNSLYIKALEKAYQLLMRNTDSLPDKREREKAILFISDGEADESDESILKYIGQRVSNGTKILTYGVGTASESAENLLRQMAEGPAGNGGVYTKVDQANNLRQYIGEFYTAFITNTSLDEPITTVPFVDYSGLGLTLGMCLPVYHLEEFVGVASLDFDIIEAISDQAFVLQGTKSYIFVIDGTGRVILHPLMPSLSDLLGYTAASWRPVFIEISTLEMTRGVDTIINSMKSGYDGNKTVTGKFILPKGDSKRDGVSIFIAEATYIWRKIQDSNYSICAVTIQNDAKMNLSAADKEEKKVCSNFIYNRVDLQEGITLCSHFGRIATLDGASTKLTQAAFIEPSRYKTAEERSFDDVVRYIGYFEGTDDLQEAVGVREGVRTIVALTEGLVGRVWSRERKYRERIVQTFVGLTEGAMMIYPGVVFHKNYDHVKRHWFRKAVARQGRLTITPPYRDAALAGTVITLAKTVVMGRQGGHSKNDPVIGVIGCDMKLSTLILLMEEVYPECAGPGFSCFIADRSGYIVIHEDFLDSEIIESDFEYVHITEKEDQISQFLINEGYMVRDRCDDFIKKETYNVWQLHIEGGAISKENAAPLFQARLIPGTDVFLFVKEIVPSSADPCLCKQEEEIPTCLSSDEDACECPCFSRVNFNICRNIVPTVEDRNSICMPETASLSLFSSSDMEITLNTTNLDMCYHHNCSVMDESSCKKYAICRYCRLVDICVAFNEPCSSALLTSDIPSLITHQEPDTINATHVKVTPTSSRPEPMPDRSQQDNKEPEASWIKRNGSYLGIVAALVVTIVIIVILACVLYKRNPNHISNYNQRPTQFAPDSTSPTSRVDDPVYSTVTSSIHGGNNNNTDQDGYTQTDNRSSRI